MYIRAKNKGESGSKAQSYYSAEQARESGTLGACSLRKVKVLQLFCFNCFIKYKNFSQKVMIEALVLCTGWSGCIDTTLWQP